MSNAKRKVKAKAKAANRKAGRPVSHAARPSTALVVRAPGPKPWLLKPEEVVILKNAVCKGATDKELEFCLAVARRYQLDPFRKQIWFVPRRDRQAEQTDGQQGGKVWVPVVSIDGLCHIAGRDHKDYGSFSEAEYGPMITISYSRNGKGATTKMQVPEWVRIEAFKKGDTRATVGKVWWEEIYPNVDYSPLVRQMPRLMLAKCAKAQAIRLAYPATGGLYIEEEMQEQTPPQFTESGRAIIQTASVSADCGYCGRQNAAATAMERCWEPSCPMLTIEQKKERNDEFGRNEQLKLLTPEQREVVERRMKAEHDKTIAPPIDIQPPKEEKPELYPGITLSLLPSGSWEINGPDHILHAQRDLFTLFWKKDEHKLICTSAAAGGLCRRFEELQIKFRMVGDS